MSVFTPVTPEQFSAWLRRYDAGTLVQMQGIAAGIENTNYFVTVTGGRYVLTLFEKLTQIELPFYLGLMAHLAQRGIPSPAPAIDLDGRMFSELNGKPAALMTRQCSGRQEKLGGGGIAAVRGKGDVLVRQLARTEAPAPAAGGQGGSRERGVVRT